MFLFREMMPNLNGTLRFFHASNIYYPVDIYMDNKLISENLAFGIMTDYLNFPAGNYKITIYKANSHDVPIHTETIEIVPNGIVTLSLVSLDNNLGLFTLKDASSSKYNDTLSFLRFINLSPNAPLLNLSLSNGDELFNSVEYLETTGYYPLSLGIYDFVLSSSSNSIPEKIINNLELKAGSFHTIYIIGLMNKSQSPLGYYLSNDGNL